jgi:hypothetical protein
MRSLYCFCACVSPSKLLSTELSSIYKLGWDCGEQPGSTSYSSVLAYFPCVPVCLNAYIPIMLGNGCVAKHCSGCQAMAQ